MEKRLSVLSRRLSPLLRSLARGNPLKERKLDERLSKDAPVTDPVGETLTVNVTGVAIGGESHAGAVVVEVHLPVCDAPDHLLPALVGSALNAVGLQEASFAEGKVSTGMLCTGDEGRGGGRKVGGEEKEVGQGRRREWRGEE
eukprot:131414-Hanusia_phi.AAC.3